MLQTLWVWGCCTVLVYGGLAWAQTATPQRPFPQHVTYAADTILPNHRALYRTHEDYYEDSVTLLSLLVMTGNYWDATRP